MLRFTIVTLKFLTDSVLEADEAAGALTGEVINRHLQTIFIETSAGLQELSGGKTTTLDVLASSRFRCEERRRAGMDLIAPIR